jgi:signal peptidase I
MTNSTDFPETKFQLVTEMLSEEIEKRGTLSFNVASNCMAPLIRIKDKVVVEKFIPEQLVSGEIIVFNIGTDLFTHRYILRQKRSGQIEYITKGDRCFKFDPPVIENQIIGKVIGIKRPAKQLDLSRNIYKLNRFCLVIVFKVQWFLFRLLRIFLSFFSKHNYF